MQPLLSKRKADAISNGVFLIGLGILFYTGAWWPGIVIAIWASIALRELLTGRIYDFVITSVILWGVFFSAFLHAKWSILLPVLFVMGGVYIICREYFFDEETPLDTLDNLEDDNDGKK